MATSTIKKITGLETIKSLNSNDDLDNLRTRGVYYVGSQVQNAPASYGMLVVTVNGDFVSQVMYSNSTYFRIRIGSPAAWTDWKRLYGGVSGEYSSTAVYCFGYITTGGNELYLIIPLKISGNAINITKLTIAVRHVGGGYVGSNGLDITSMIAETRIAIAQDILIVRAVNSSGWGATNNTPVIGSVNLTCTIP